MSNRRIQASRMDRSKSTKLATVGSTPTACTMTKDQAIELLKELVEEIDYDIYKDIFIYGEPINVDELVKIVLKHTNKQCQKEKAKPRPKKGTQKKD